MAHYGRLADYHFTEGADDIRGAEVYGANEQKLGKVADVVFDHHSGDVRYLIVSTGKRKVAVPADHIFRGARDENSFSVDMSPAQFEALPDFSDDYLENEHRWNEFHRHNEESLSDWRKEMERKYKHGGWYEAPVQHREGSTHNITPEPGEIVSGSPEPGKVVVGRGSLGEDVIEPSPGGKVEGEEFTPHRLAGRFPDPIPGPQKIYAHPASAVEESKRFTSGTEGGAGMFAHEPGSGVASEALDTHVEEAENREALHREAEAGQTYSSSPRWRSFEDLLRKNRVDITARCSSCKPARDKAA